MDLPADVLKLGRAFNPRLPTVSLSDDHHPSSWKDWCSSSGRAPQEGGNQARRGSSWRYSST